MAKQSSEATPARSDDRRTLSASNSANDALSRLVVYGWFDDQIEAYRVAIAVALANDLTSDDAPMRENVTTKYNVGSVDPEGKLRTLVQIMRPEEERPYAAMEVLAEAGLHFILRNLDEENRMLSDILDASIEPSV